jgi:hypothetical protein
LNACDWHVSHSVEAHVRVATASVNFVIVRRSQQGGSAMGNPAIYTQRDSQGRAKLWI